MRLADMWGVVQVAVGVRVIKIDGGRDEAVLHRHDG